MKTGFSLRGLSSRFSVLNGLTGLAGFAAGVVLASLIVMEQTPISQAAETPSLAASSVNSPAPRGEPIPVEVPARAGAAAAWAFESSAAAPARDPGKNRPDLLSAPEGWTYVAE